MRTTLEHTKGRSNNLQMLRFAAAVMVIMGHSFALSTGVSKGEWFLVITGGKLSMGEFAVSIFFCAGGYLIAKSVSRVHTFRGYFTARVLRIFPLLFLVVLLCMFAVGPLFTSLPWSEYFVDKRFVKYFLNAVLFLQHDLPGVFMNNPYGSTVNGALWTLPVEFLCYIGCFVMYHLKWFHKKLALISVPLVVAGCFGIFALSRITGSEVLTAVIRPCLLFYIGIMYYIYRDKVVLDFKMAAAGAGAFLLLCVLGFVQAAMVLVFPYLLLYFCFAARQVGERFARLGDLSYGIYLCGFPIQQMLVHQNQGSMNPYVNMVISISVAIALSYLLFRFVEQPVMNLEKKKRLEAEKSIKA